MRILLFPNPTRADATAFAEDMLRRLRVMGHEAYLYQGADDPRLAQTELAIIAGGDGSVLRAVRALYRYSFPYFAVNFGHLGYLTECNPSGMEAALPRLLSGDYTLEKRAMLGGTVRSAGSEETFVGLNEVVIHRGDSIRPLKLALYVDGTQVMRFAGDGLLISTPTGSTAYNLSAGGPILLPGSKQLVLTPICAHAAVCAPLVVSGRHSISVLLDSGENGSPVTNACVDVDGCHRMILAPGGQVDCSLAPWRACFIRTTDESFYQRLQMKLSEKN